MTESNDNSEVSKPSLLWLATEPQRALIEYGLSIPYKLWASRKTTGDGHPVLVLPGFMATDRSTAPLRRHIDSIGYQTYGWDIGRNFGKEEYINKLSEKIKHIQALHDEQVSLIGWSLGGVFARQLAKETPHLIRQVITLGSPFRNVMESNNASWIHQILRGGKNVSAADEELLADLPIPAPVPTTAIYTKEDGVVPWQYCLEAVETELHQNIQVRGSHIGLGFNAAVLQIITERLTQTRYDWKKYEPQSSFEDRLILPTLRTT